MGQGDPGAQEALWRFLYAELHAQARRTMRRQRPDHTLQPTALVNEVWLRVSRAGGAWRDREHFLATVSRAMRQVLVDAARARGSEKRTPLGARAALDDLLVDFEDRSFDLEALDHALSVLSQADPEMARVRRAALLRRGRGG